jgi:hypothetical protein
LKNIELQGLKGEMIFYFSLGGLPEMVVVKKLVWKDFIKINDG